MTAPLPWPPAVAAALHPTAVGWAALGAAALLEWTSAHNGVLNALALLAHAALATYLVVLTRRRALLARRRAATDEDQDRKSVV